MRNSRGPSRNGGKCRHQGIGVCGDCCQSRHAEWARDPTIETIVMHGVGHLAEAEDLSTDAAGGFLGMSDSDLPNAWSRPLRTGIVDIARTVADGRRAVVPAG